MRLIKKIPNVQPLLYFDGHLIVAKNASLYWVNGDLTCFEKITSLPLGIRHRLTRKSRHLTRVFRSQVGPAIRLGTRNEILVWLLGKVYKINVKTGSFEEEDVRPQGRAPLSMCYSSGQNELPPGVFFGEYFSNPSKAPAFIWHRDERGNWSRIFKFSAGEINHIHAIVVDPYCPQLVVLTGDYGEAASIWSVDTSFRYARRLALAGQNSRACWIIPAENNFVYATDTHFEPNSVRRISRNTCGPKIESEMVSQTMGSSIYSLSGIDNTMYFSTAVEPGKPGRSRLTNMLTAQWGPGINGPYCAIYGGNDSVGFRPLFKRQVDGLPLRLFGFGSFSFPSGRSPASGYIHSYASGIKGLDGHTLLLEAS